MAKVKTARIDILRSANTAYLKVAEERKNLHVLGDLAQQSGNERVLEMFKSAEMRYEEDYKMLSEKRAYQLGKLIAESPVMFDRILKEVLS